MLQKVLFSLASNEYEVFEANVFAIGTAFENDTKSVRVHAELVKEHTNLLPGMYVNALIETNPSLKKVLPNEAIISEGEEEFIFVKLNGSSHEGHSHEGHDHEKHMVLFEKVAVKTGSTELGYTEIIQIDEMPENSGIVTIGAFYLQAEMKKGEAGHVH